MATTSVVGARDHEDVDAVATDLELRHGGAVTPIVVDLNGPTTSSSCT